MLKKFRRDLVGQCLVVDLIDRVEEPVGVQVVDPLELFVDRERRRFDVSELRKC